MKAILKDIMSPDVPDLATYTPNAPDNFGLLFQLFIGPENEIGEESFQLVVCTPTWLATHYKSGFIIGRHHLVVFTYDYNAILDFITSQITQCTGNTWKEIAIKLSRFAHWEFEDYKP